MDAYLNSNFSLHELLEKQIPVELQNLEESSNNLEHLAAFSENEYLTKSLSEKKQALERTKQYTTQSLASVAYQVNQLSSMLLRCIDLEEENIASKLNDVTNIAQEISIANERSSRQQIGVFTHSKNIARMNKILYPSRRLKAPRHQFSEINFSALDNIGHAPKESPPSKPVIIRNNSILSGSDTMSSYSNQQTYDYMTNRGNTTLSRKSMRSEVYRPQIPSFADLQRYSTVTNTMVSENGSLHYNPSIGSRSTIMPMAQPPLGSISQYRLSLDSNEGGLPPPPAVLTRPNEEPLPPPPFASHPMYESEESHTPDWVPAHYIEKALAIYDYEAEKEDELNLRENCIVYVVAKNEDGWYEGVMDGMTGLFPSNYVQTL